MKRKIVLILSVVIVLIIFLVGLFVVKNNYKIELKSEKFNYEFGEEISADVSLFLKDADSTKNIKDYRIKSEKLEIKDNKFSVENKFIIPVGEYKAEITYKNKTSQFLIIVLDTTPPEFVDFNDNIDLEETSDDIDLSSYFKVNDLSSTTLEIIGEYKLSKVGVYNLTVEAKDIYNNSSSKEFNLNIKEKPKKVVEKEDSVKTTSNRTSNNATNTNSSTKSSNTSQTQQSPYNGYRKDISNSYVNQINAYRKANGLSELPVTSEAQAEADRRSKELVNYYSHDGVGYGFGEIIGHGDAGGDFITAWKNSPPHNASMLREQNTAIAASVYEVNGHWYAVVSFRMDY